jgi:hypothetical protein
VIARVNRSAYAQRAGRSTIAALLPGPPSAAGVVDVARSPGHHRGQVIDGSASTAHTASRPAGRCQTVVNP